MSFRITIASLLTLFVTSLLAISLPGHANADLKKNSTTHQFAGHWVDHQNAAIKMSVTEDGGIYRITGGDEAYGYNLSCLLKGKSAVCTGSGGRLEGENFLYQSTIEFGADGMAVENWKAFNNLQTVNGSTSWKR